MDPKDGQSYPFVTRDMLSFKHGLVLGLRIRSQAANSTTITIRGATREGIFTFKHTNTGVGTIQTENFRIPDIPIWISLVDDAETLPQGDFYATLSLTANGDILYELLSGLVYANKSISYPKVNSYDGRPLGGSLNTRTSANPVAGAECTIEVPAGRVWKVLAMEVSLVTDATAANRRPHFVFNLATGGFIDMFSDQDHAASLTRRYHVANFGAMPDTLDDNDILVPLAQGMILPPLTTIDTETTNLQVTDNYGQLSVLVEEFWELA